MNAASSSRASDFISQMRDAESVLRYMHTRIARSVSCGDEEAQSSTFVSASFNVTQLCRRMRVLNLQMYAARRC